MIQLMKKRIFPEEMEILYDRPFTPESLEKQKELENVLYCIKLKALYLQSVML